MKRIRTLLLRFFLLIVSVIFALGGKCVMLSGKQVILNPSCEQNGNRETLDCHFFSLLTENEKWCNKEEFQPGFLNVVLSSVIKNIKLNPHDFSNPVWQPPKA